MKLRVARHTNNLEAIEQFYCKIIGLENIGGFQNHNGYDGLFLGKRGLDWHLEFTQSDVAAVHSPDDDDLLVFYVTSERELHNFKRLLAVKRIKEEEPKNPYWKSNSILIKDPDGFGVMISLDGKR